MSDQLGLFLRELAQAQSENFPCEYDAHFLSKKEADDLFSRFLNWGFCPRHSVRNRQQIFKRRGVVFVSDVNHPQVQATYNRRIGTYTTTEEDGCVGPTLPFDERTPDEIKRLRDKLSARIDRDVNYISVQIYPDGSSIIDWHRHSEDDGVDSPVLIVSTGEERDFHIRLNEDVARTLESKKRIELAEHRGGIKKKVDYSKHWNRPAQHGSLIVLPASFNDTHEHAILKDKSKQPRISINTKCLVAPRVYDCHAEKRYPGSLMPELNCLNPAVYVGCKVQRGGKVIREGTPYGNGQDPLKGHYPIIADNEHDFRTYAEKRMQDPEFRAQAIKDLQGKHLLCWCKQDGSQRPNFCHARVWLEIVNRPG